MPDEVSPPLEVLFVCTANQGRSPVAEFLLRCRLLARAGAEQVVVRSAGVMPGGVEISEPVVAAVAPFGVDLSGYRSRQLTAELVRGADLVVAMAVEHARHVVALRPDAAARTYTLKELVGRVAAAGGRRPDEAVSLYLARVRPLPVDGWEPGPGLDVADPYGKPLAALAETVAEIDALVGRLVASLWP